MDDAEIVRQMKMGNKEAFHFLYEKYKNLLFRTACLISGNRTDGEDILQETFVKCFLHINELQKEEGLRPWLFQILTRTAWQYCKKRGKEIPDEEILDKLEDNLVNSPLATFLASERAAQIQKSIKALDVKHKTVIVLYYYNEMSTREISMILNCKEGTIKSRLFQARTLLRKDLVTTEKGTEETCHEKNWIYG